MKILFLHGWHSIPGGVKPTYLMEHGHVVINPALDDDDFQAAIQTAQDAFDRHQPDVVVGSSRGGAVAMNIKTGSVKLVLLCPAWKNWGAVNTVKPGSVILHSRADDVIPFGHSEELLANSGLSASALIEVGNDHRLADLKSLQTMLAACMRKDWQSSCPPRDAYQVRVLATTPIAYWPLRETAKDVSGHRNDGLFIGSPEFVQDKTGGWLKLDGKSYIEVPSTPSFSQPTSGDGMTVEVWMRTHVRTLSKPYIHWLGKGEPGKHEWAFRFYSDNSDRPNRLSAYVWNSDGGCGAGAYSQEKIDIDTWMHFVACFQSGNAESVGTGVLLYKNGELKQGPELSEATHYHYPPHWMIYPTAGDAPLRFGNRNDPACGLIGGLAEIAIYPRVLDATEITDHFRAGSMFAN